MGRGYVLIVIMAHMLRTLRQRPVRLVSLGSIRLKMAQFYPALTARSESIRIIEELISVLIAKKVS